MSDEFLRENNVQFLVQLIDISQESSAKAQIAHNSLLGVANGTAVSQETSVVGPDEEAKTFSAPQSNQLRKDSLTVTHSQSSGLQLYLMNLWTESTRREFRLVSSWELAEQVRKIKQ